MGPRVLSFLFLSSDAASPCFSMWWEASCRVSIGQHETFLQQRRRRDRSMYLVVAKLLLLPQLLRFIFNCLTQSLSDDSDHQATYWMHSTEKAGVTEKGRDEGRAIEWGRRWGLEPLLRGPASLFQRELRAPSCLNALFRSSWEVKG